MLLGLLLGLRFQELVASFDQCLRRCAVGHPIQGLLDRQLVLAVECVEHLVHVGVTGDGFPRNLRRIVWHITYHRPDGALS